MGLDITRATVADLALIEPLWREMLDHHADVADEEWPVRDPDNSWRMKRAQYEARLDDPNSIIFIARSSNPDAAALGYLGCKLVSSGPTFDLGSRRGEVDALAVAIEARGRGIGTALLQACRDELVARGCAFWGIGVVAGNEAAVRLYERMGFKSFSQELIAPLS